MPAERGDHFLHGVIDDVLQLQLVLVVGVGGREVAKLLHQLVALVDVLGRHEVFGDFDAAVKVEDLKE